MLKNRIDEFACREAAQVFDALADADEFDRQLELAGDTDGNTTFGGAVECCEDHAADTECLVEFAGLNQRILTGVRVEHE